MTQLAPTTLRRLLLTTILLLPVAQPVYAAQVIGAMSSAPRAGEPDLSIAAVVGDEAISSYDVENRIRFIIATARISNTPDVLKVIRPQVIHSLIDEKLQIQEAAKNKITATPQDLAEAIAGIEQQRGMPAGTIANMLASSGVPKDTFEQQIRAQLLWNRLLMKKIRPGVHISDEELKIASRKFSLNPPKKKEAAVPQEYKIAVIALPVEKASQDASVKALAAKLVQQIRAGASFEEVSRQFSSVTANTGGKVESFWIRLGQLDPAVATILNGSEKNTVTSPVRTAQGYTIIKVYDTRAIPGKKPLPEKEEEPKDTEITLKEILLNLKPDAETLEADVMLQIGGEVAKNPGTCEDQGVANIADAQGMNIDVTYKKYALSEMPEGLKDVVDKLKIGEISSPLATYEGIRLYMLCGKKSTDNKPVNKELVYSMLIQQKMDLEAQKYLRNLRRETFIDTRQ
jgi:peptidyl-prolyl cis-trans isomerase SurA